jgi:hypothetical protein
MKKTLLTLFALILSLLAAHAAEDQVRVQAGELFYYLSSTYQTATVTYEKRGYGYAELEHVKIPKTVQFNGQSYTVTSIGEQAFKASAKLVSVEMPNTVKYIGYEAFRQCENLQQVKLGKSTLEIGSYAFSDCKNLKEIKLPKGLKLIKKAAFNHCENLSSIVIPAGTDLQELVFSYCTSLRSVTIEEGLKKLREGVFSHCSSLQSVTIPASVSDFGFRPFVGCTDLRQINVAQGSLYFTVEDGVLFNKPKTKLLLYPANKSGEPYKVPSTVTVIGAYAFADNEAIPLVWLPKNLLAIENGAFMNCKELTYITLPEGLLSIGDKAFYGCGLRKATLPASLKTLGQESFMYCTHLSEIQIPDYITTIQTSAFSHCERMVVAQLPKGLLYIKQNAFYGCYALSDITLPEGLRAIGDNAFRECNALPSVSIPASVNSVGVGAYAKCAILTHFEVDAANKNLCAVDGVLHNSDTTTLLLFPAAKTADTYRILPSVTSIAPSAMLDVVAISTLVIPAGVQTINEQAFGYYPKMTRIICYATIPPAISPYTVSYTLSNAILSVPAESLELYRQATGWKQFKTIEPIQ